MTIPLDNLYDYIFSLTDHTNKNLRMFRFDPHGSKNIENLICHNNTEVVFITLSNSEKRESWHYKQIFCHDQEPLNFEFYNSTEIIESRKKLFFDRAGKKNKINTPIGENWYRKKNIAGHPSVLPSIYDKKILLHSEKNSSDLKKYEKNNFLGVYYWAHAFIALDWYRFAEHDKLLKNIPDTSFIKDFNIYCRSWSGSREYRLKLLSKLKSQDIAKKSNIFFNECDAGKHYCDYKIENKHWELTEQEKNNIKKINYISNQNSDPALSAAYNPDNYKESAIDVVLETVFDQQKIHLTEKILRPIACGKPFILISEKGSLDYLKYYGFKTFDNLIDESYDQIDDPKMRMDKIINTMKNISQLTKGEKNKLYLKMHEIAVFNKNWFFSNDFFNIINQELIKNLSEKLSLLDDPKYQTAKEPTLIYRAYRRYEKYFSDIEKDISQNVISYNEYPERIRLNKKI